MQCPLNGDVNNKFDLPNDLEREFSKRLESVRKDVECTFGVTACKKKLTIWQVLKNRFRILKVPLLCCGRNGQEKVDNIFYTCCMIHNMLLEHDGYIDWTSDWSHLPGLDTGLLSECNPNLTGSVQDWNTPEHQDRYYAHHNAGNLEQEGSFFTLRKQLLEHFSNPIAKKGMLWNTLTNRK